jgi:Cu-Zn family superoxide dismutase
MKLMLSALPFLASLALTTGASANDDHRGEVRSVRAIAKISACDAAATGPISGVARLIERPSSEGVKVVDISMRVRGLSDGKHAVHVHAVGLCAPCSMAGGHFDPGPSGNPSPDGNHPFHSGDLINIEAKRGHGAMRTTTSRITLSPGPLSVFDLDGSAIIIHAQPDTYCPGGEIAGCAGGARTACGKIELVSDESDSWFD